MDDFDVIADAAVILSIDSDYLTNYVTFKGQCSLKISN